MLPLVPAVAAGTLPATDWPQFHGPDHSNKSADTELLESRSDGGPLRPREAKTEKAVRKCSGAKDKPGYASPIFVDYQKLKQIVTVMARSVVGVRASDGKLLWRYSQQVYAVENILTPPFQGGFVIVRGCARKGATSLRLPVSGKECLVERQWHNATLDNKRGGVVLVNDGLCGYAQTRVRHEPRVCVDFRTGETIFQCQPLRPSCKYRSGSLTYANGMFCLCCDNGNVGLTESDGYGVRTHRAVADRESG